MGVNAKKTVGFLQRQKTHVCWHRLSMPVFYSFAVILKN